MSPYRTRCGVNWAVGIPLGDCLLGYLTIRLLLHMHILLWYNVEQSGDSKWRIGKNEEGRSRDLFKELSQNLPQGTEENHENFQSWYLV